MSSPEDADTPLVPPAFVASVLSLAGPAAAAWIERLPALVAAACARWTLVVDGPSMHGVAGLVVPVRTADGVGAALKVSWPHDEAVAEAAALRCWAGTGAVRLLAANAPDWTMLLERLDATRSLEEMSDPDRAVELAASLLPRLHVVAPPEIPTVRALTERWIDELAAEWEGFGRPMDRRLLDQALATCRGLGSEDRTAVLHGDFHYANVLAGEREPWLAIDPKPLAGDPAFDVAPLLRNRWDDLTRTGDLVGAIRRRFDQIVEVSGLDRERARAWVVARAVDNILWATDNADRDLALAERAIAETLGD